MERHIFNDVVTLYSKNGKQLSIENKEFRNALLDIIIIIIIVHMQTLLNCYPAYEGFMLFDRQTRSTLWNLLNINSPWMNMEV